MLPKLVICWIVCAFGVGILDPVAGSSSAESLTNCDGKCVPEDVSCVSTSESNSCGKESKCCLDVTPGAATLETQTTVEDEAPEFFSSEAETEMRFMSFMDLDGRSPRDWGSFNSSEPDSEGTTQAPPTGWGSFDDPTTGSPLSTPHGSQNTEPTEWGSFSEHTASPVTLPTIEGTFHDPTDTSRGRATWEDENSKCPGMCMPKEEASFCVRPFPFKSLCENDGTCCLTEIQAFKIKLLSMQKATDQVPDGAHEIRKIFETGKFGDLSDLHCPSTCLLPSNAEGWTVLDGFYCPGRSLCCLKTPLSVDQSTQCAGECIPPHLHSLCRPPKNKIFLSEACKSPLLCCEPKDFKEWLKSLLAHVPPPFYVGNGNEQFFYVSTDVEVFELDSLPPDALQFDGQNLGLDSLTGKVWFLKDPTSNLWERYRLLPKDSDDQESMSHSYLNSEGMTARIAFQGEAKDSPEFVIPDEEDYPQQFETANLDVTIRPPCPGFCVSYYKRFMCFRNYTTYDGFHCPGKLVCCGKLEDVKKHEDFLMFLYPYLQRNKRNFNPKCGKKGRKEESSKTLPGEWCWQVAILDSKNHYICGGALIDYTWVLTSAHCVAAFVSVNHDLFIRAGINDLTSMKENAVAQTRRVLRVYFHYNFDAVTLDNDIALLKLVTPLNLNANVCFTCLPPLTALPQEGTKCTITGYGFVHSEGMALHMKEAEVSLDSDMDCISNMTDALSAVHILPASSFCASHEKRYCQIAYGNPLVCKVEGQYELIGLVSWALGCGFENTPTIYVKIPVLMGWINHIRAADYELYRKNPNQNS